MARTLIVTPTYNERDNLEGFVAAVRSALPEADLLIVDDASPDGTGDIADALAAKDAHVKVRHRAGKLGLGTAYLEAFAWGLGEGYDRFFEMDADHSHDPKYLADFVRALDSGADVVIGSRNIPGGGVEGWGPLRHFISKGGSLYSRTILGLSVRDLTSGYKAFSRRALEAIGLGAVQSNGYSFQVELTFRAALRGLKIVEVPILFVDRRAGQSKMSGKIFREAIVMVWKMRIAAVRGQL
jgi:dolichol-phosphate mannosyltransferase